MVSQCWVLIFERAILLSRFGRQTANNFAHRATRSKMAGFRTTPLFWGYGQGRFFGCVRSAKFCAYSGVSLILTRPGEGGPVRMDTPAENTVVVCDTISRITKMLPVLLNCHFGSFVPCSEQNVHPLPVSDAGPFAHFCAKVLSSKNGR